MPAAKKSVRQPPAKTAAELVPFLVDLLMRGSDLDLAAVGIADARRAGFVPDAAVFSAWKARIAQLPRASYASLRRAHEVLEDDDLLPALIEAALRDRELPPLRQEWTETIDWDSVTEGTRWGLLDLMVKTAGDVIAAYGDDRPEVDLLGFYLADLLPTVIPIPLGRLEWWFGKARSEVLNRDTDLNFGSEAQGVATDWVAEAAKTTDLGELKRLARALKECPDGAMNHRESWVDAVDLGTRRARAAARKLAKQRAAQTR